MTREVLVECDRCRRPVAPPISLGADGQGLNFGVVPNPEAARGHYVKAVGQLKGRELLDASPPGGYADRFRLACTGRRHPVYERTVTREKLRAGIAAALAEGRTRIGMREL